MVEKLAPVLSGSLREIIQSIVDKTSDPIASEIIRVNNLVENFNSICFYIGSNLGEEIVSKIINEAITDEVRMLSMRVGEFEISFLPKGKEPEYVSSDTWGRKNRQTGKPAKIFQKLLKKEFKTREWEIFSNLIKAELCDCINFELVEGEDIRNWYLDSNYYKCEGTLGNSCMRHDETQSFFDIYVDNAKMLITTKNGLLTGRAIVWEIGDITIMDRVYTCFDYLENCFFDYAKEHKWWIRSNNHLLSTGDSQGWLRPEDDYDRDKVVYTCMHIHLKQRYDEFPYVDSFRYYDGGKEIASCPEYDYALDCTDGTFSDINPEYPMDCDHCGRTFYAYSEDDIPDELHWSEWSNGYYCDDCCWYCSELCDYVCNSDEPVVVHSGQYVASYPSSYIDDNLIMSPDGSETNEDIVEINGEYYLVNPAFIEYNEKEHKYEVRSDTH